MHGVCPISCTACAQSPAWRVQVFSEDCQVVLHVVDRNYVSPNETLGEVSFPLKAALKDQPLPTSGVAVTLVRPLHALTHSSKRLKRTMRGELRFRIGWRLEKQGAEDLVEHMALGGITDAPELENLAEEDASLQESTAAGGEDDGTKKKKGKKATAEEEQAERLRAESIARQHELEASAMRRELRAGVYQLQVHVVEARELTGRDAGGVNDAMVVVSAFGQQRHTEVKYKQSNPLWDEHIFIDSRGDLDEVGLNQSQIHISVYDVDLVSRDLVGHFIVDAATIYYKPDHELWRTWVTLSAPHHERERLFGIAAGAEGGIQGKLLLSLTLIGPGDSPKVHTDNERSRSSRGSPEVVLLHVCAARTEGSWLAGAACSLTGCVRRCARQAAVAATAPGLSHDQSVLRTWSTADGLGGGRWHRCVRQDALQWLLGEDAHRQVAKSQLPSAVLPADACAVHRRLRTGRSARPGHPHARRVCGHHGHQL
jgi:hypothetical protein